MSVNWTKVMRFVYWSIGSVFMFIAGVVTISVLKPGPTEAQVMKWMEGMMGAMHSSLMGASMDNGEKFGYMLQTSAKLSFVMILIAIPAGVLIRWGSSFRQASGPIRQVSSND